MKIPYISKKIEERKEIKKIREEHEWMRKMSIYRAKLNKMRQAYREFYQKHEACIYRLKDLVKKYGTKSNTVRNKVGWCIFTEKIAKIIEMLADETEILMDEIETIRMLDPTEFEGLFKILDDILENANKAGHRNPEIDLSLIEYKFKVAWERISRFMEGIKRPLQKIPIENMNISESEINDELNKVVAEINAEEEEELREKEAKRRITKIAEGSEL